MIKDFDEFKAKKNGKITPKSLTDSLIEWIGTGDVETLVISVKTKDGELLTAYSQATNTEYIGMLEISKMRIIEETF